MSFLGQEAAARNQTLHISSGLGHTLKQIYRAAAHLLRSEIEPVYVSNSLVEASSIVLDNALAQHVLRWHPEFSFTEGVQHAIERFQGSTEPAGVVAMVNVGTTHSADQFIAPRKREMAIMGAQ